MVAEVVVLLVAWLEVLPIRGDVLEPPTDVLASSIDTALQRSHEALTLAQEVAHPFSLAYALAFAAQP